VVIVITVVIVVSPFPAMIATPIFVAVHSFPSPIIVLLVPASLIPRIPVVVILLGHYAAVVLRERVAGINAGLTVAVSASAKALSVAGAGYGRRTATRAG
jgi:hypothetical protein